MSYYITISGHFDDPETAEASEEEVLAKAKDFVAGLGGANTASMQGQFTGTTSLTPIPEPGD